MINEGAYLSFAVESIRFKTISESTSAAAPANPPEAAPKRATSIGTNLHEPVYIPQHPSTTSDESLDALFA